MSLIDRMKDQAEQTAAKTRASAKEVQAKARAGAQEVQAQAKAGAQEVQAKAHAAADQVQARRELSQAYAELGSSTADLIARGELSHPQLAPTAARIGELRAQLDAEQAGTSTA